MTNTLSRADAPVRPSMSEERLLDARQLAAYLGLDESRLWLMRLLQASLRGPHSVRVAGHAYWWRSDVDEWLRSHDLGEVLRGLGEDVICAATRIAS
jgi:predicted DNA-binding transcriptional regulator AlpA